MKPPAKPQKAAQISAESVSSAAVSGDRLRTLEAMRRKLAADMDEAPAAVVAQIAGRLSAVLVEIDEITKQAPVRSVVDELRNRRAARADVVEGPRRQTRERRGG